MLLLSIFDKNDLQTLCFRISMIYILINVEDLKLNSAKVDITFKSLYGCHVIIKSPPLIVWPFYQVSCKSAICQGYGRNVCMCGHMHTRSLSHMCACMLVRTHTYSHRDSKPRQLILLQTINYQNNGHLTNCNSLNISKLHGNCVACNKHSVTNPL